VKPGIDMDSAIDGTVCHELRPSSRPRHHFHNAARPLFQVVARLRKRIIRLRVWYLRTVMKMDLHPKIGLSLKANLDFTNPRGVHVAEGTYISFNAVILAHDMSRLLHADTYVGRNCFIGAHSIILAGVRVGDECIVGTGAVVTKDVPSHSIVAGNPARVIRSGIRTKEWGILEEAYHEATRIEAARG